MTTNQVRIKDNGWDKIMADMKRGKRMQLRVGILEDEGAKIHPRTGKTIQKIAQTNEWGEGNIPSRSMIRTWVDENVTKMRAEIVRAYERVLRRHMSHSAEEAEWARLGEKYVKQVQGRIQRKRIPPVNNRPMTIRRKGFNHPLIEEGILIDSFTFKVVK